MAGAVERTGGICLFDRKFRSWDCLTGDILTAGDLDLALGGVVSSLAFRNASLKLSSSLSNPAFVAAALLWFIGGVVVLL